MLEMFTGHSLWDYITILFDNIPKIIYLIYTAIASCLDLLQLLLRKLAGLDTYWVNGTAYTQQDPILEFIFGMLGIGPNAGAYSALSTVFWSLAIFGVIVLVISTMVAIIKSHYNEDSNKTNPLSYIYTAIKAIFTFAIVPVAVILGIYISQFLLQTMDNITAGKATEDTLRGIYGDSAAAEFVATDGVYTRYDFFGAGDKASSQTFSGMLFRVAAYDANRVRRGSYSVDAIAANNVSANRVFGATGTSGQKNASDQEWVAYQIDYAFMNNLELKGGIWAAQLYIAASGEWGYGIGNTLVSIYSMDFFTFVGGSTGFSKYNVGLVWYYYYLWNFNFFVGFASIIISLGLLVGIIIGLMSRLIFGAALFLIFPPTLGLAPLDDWRAFKEWRKKFVAQILMAFGSIIGMNVFFLILPYVNEIDWFGVSRLGSYAQNSALNLPNYIVNTLVIIVGLLAVKTFISFVSGLIGADDANATGDGLKKGLTDTLAKAGGATLGMANIGVKMGTAAYRFGTQTLMGGFAERKVKKIDEENDALERKMSTDEDRADRLRTANNRIDIIRNRFASGRGGAQQAGYNAAINLAEQRARAMGINTTAAAGTADANAWEQMKREAADQYLISHDSNFKNFKDVIDRDGYSEEDMKRRSTIDENKTRRQNLVAKNYLNEKGEFDDKSASQIGRQLARDIGGALMKGLQEGTKDLTGINMGAIQGVFNRFDNNHRDKDGKIDGRYGGLEDNDAYRKAAKAREGMTFRERVRDTVSNTARDMTDAMFHAAPTPPPPKADSADKRMERSADKLERTADALLKATENLRRFKP